VSDRLRIALLIVAASLALWVGATQTNPAVRWAEASVEQVAVTTGGAYVSLRVINAALSAAQEIEIGASVGAQASAQPLKVLEPVDDTVERVADVVFAVAAGAAVAAVGLAPVAALGAMVLAAGLLGMALGLAFPAWTAPLRRMAARAARLGAAIAVVLPLVISLGLDIGARMTAPVAAEAEAVLSGITSEAELLIGGAVTSEQTEEGPAGEGIFSGLADRLSAAGDAVDGAMAAVRDYRDAAAVFLSEADALFAATMTLIGVFVLQTLVLPALLFWGVMSILRRSVD
jgi:hypothetical protein